jgi:hypothetical protein
MWPFHRRREHAGAAGSRRARELQRALDEESANEALETEYERVDEANVSAAQVRAGAGIFGLFGQGVRRGVRQQLKEEGYDGD